ncbi:SDR family NAD(P)-dependent oxidoreductase [Virgibacillus ainsalahensis]
MQNKLANKKVIVTGASSGIGERIVWHVAKNGGIPIMLARSGDKLRRQKKRIEEEFHVTSFVYRVDLQNSADLDMKLKQILLEHDRIQGLINNAGAGVFKYVKDMEIKDVTNMLQLNVTALIRITKRVLPHLHNREGHIVNIASQAGKMATPKSAVYGATKHAVLGFTNGLRMEVAADGIYVTSVNLGPVRTNFFDVADPDGNYQKSVDRYMLDPDKVAQKIIKHMFTDKREINLPWWMELGSKMYYQFPGLMEHLLRKQFNKK